MIVSFVGWFEVDFVVDFEVDFVVMLLILELAVDFDFVLACVTNFAECLSVGEKTEEKKTIFKFGYCQIR